jgi:hypothetical protein
MRPRSLSFLFYLLACQMGPLPEQAARSWAADLGIKVDGVSCTQTDTDNDGYVSCTINKGDNQLISLECATGRGLASGCKQKVAKITRPWD